MQAAKRTLYLLLFFLTAQGTLFSQQLDFFFCDALNAVINDANNHFEAQTHRDRGYLMNTVNENRFDAEFGLPFFEFEKIISRGIEGLYYECMIPNFQDSQKVLQSLKDIDFQLKACVSGLVSNPNSNPLSYNYHYQRGDTAEDIFIRVWGTYPSIDSDSFFMPGQVNMEIYGDDRRMFVPYKVDAKKADAVLRAELQKIEKGLLDNIDLIKGEATKDLYNNVIYKTKVKITGAGNAFIKEIPENMLMEYGYFGEFYVGPSFDDAKNIYNKWNSKIKHNAFTEKRFSQKNRKRLSWIFLPYNELFDPTDYANIILQSGYSCPIYSEEPLNRTPLFTYHVFLLKYIDSYIVGVNIANRF